VIALSAPPIAPDRDRDKLRKSLRKSLVHQALEVDGVESRFQSARDLVQNLRLDVANCAQELAAALSALGGASEELRKVEDEILSLEAAGIEECFASVSFEAEDLKDLRSQLEQTAAFEEVASRTLELLETERPRKVTAD